MHLYGEKLQQSCSVPLTILSNVCDFEQCGILTSPNKDEPVQPPFKLRNSEKCSISSLTFIEHSSD